MVATWKKCFSCVDLLFWVILSVKKQKQKQKTKKGLNGTHVGSRQESLKSGTAFAQRNPAPSGLKRCVVGGIHDGKPVFSVGGAVHPAQRLHQLQHRHSSYSSITYALRASLNNNRTNGYFYSNSWSRRHLSLLTWMLFFQFSLLGLSSTILEAYFKALPYILLAKACL